VGSVLTSRLCCRFQLEWPSIVSGTDEGIYGWVAVNYLRDALGQAAISDTHAAAPAAHGIGGQASASASSGVAGGSAGGSISSAVVGTLDMGGSSLEVGGCRHTTKT
jgi:hypothetical protein